MGGGCQELLLAWRGWCCWCGAAGGLADGDGGDPVCAGGAAADDLWRAVAKRSRQAPADVLPLQYAVSLGLCLLIAPVSGFRFTVNAGLIIPVLFLGLLISVVAQLLLYRLLSAGNIVNVTSLFYLVPAITALLDYLLLGNRLPAAAMIGMMAIVGGIVLVFRTAKVRAG